MKKVLVAVLMMLFAAPVFADKPVLPPVVHHKKKPKKRIICGLPVPKKPPVVVAPPLVFPPVVIAKPAPPAIVVVPPCPVVCPPEGTSVVSVHLGVGVGARQPYASGLIGLRIEFPTVYLGVEPFISVPFGAGVDGMVYVYRGPVVQVYPLSVGFMVNFNHSADGVFGAGNRFLSDQDINRNIDLRLGAGVQIRLRCKLSLAVDWRVSLPDPVKLGSGTCYNCGTSGAERINGVAAVKNALAESQLIVGLLF